jgi:hypothetical protein
MVQRDALCMSTMQAVERDVICMSTLLAVDGYTLQVHAAGRGKGVHPHLHNGDGRKGYTLISKLQVVESDMPCMCTLQEMERKTPSTSTCWCVGGLAHPHC